MFWRFCWRNLCESARVFNGSSESDGTVDIFGESAGEVDGSGGSDGGVYCSGESDRTVDIFGESAGGVEGSGEPARGFDGSGELNLLVEFMVLAILVEELIVLLNLMLVDDSSVKAVGVLMVLMILLR